MAHYLYRLVVSSGGPVKLGDLPSQIEWVRKRSDYDCTMKKLIVTNDEIFLTSQNKRGFYACGCTGVQVDLFFIPSLFLTRVSAGGQRKQTRYDSRQVWQLKWKRIPSQI